MSISSISGGSNSLQQQLFSRIDTNGDGKLDKSEFLKGRPKGVSESDASALFDKLDSKKSGSLSEADLEKAAGQNGAPPLFSQTSSSSFDPSTLLSLLQQTNGSSTDSGTSSTSTSSTDGSQSISRADFLKNRPDGVSEQDAGKLFDSIDTGHSGTITGQQLADGLRAQAQDGGGPPIGQPSSGADQGILSLLKNLNGDSTDSKSTSTTTSTKTSTTTDSTESSTSTSSKTVSELQKFLDAIQSYNTGAQYSSNNNVNYSSLLTA